MFTTRFILLLPSGHSRHRKIIKWEKANLAEKDVFKLFQLLQWIWIETSVHSYQTTLNWNTPIYNWLFWFDSLWYIEIEKHQESERTIIFCRKLGLTKVNALNYRVGPLLKLEDQYVWQKTRIHCIIKISHTFLSETFKFFSLHRSV